MAARVDPLCRALFETCSDGVLIVAADGSLLDANPAACGLLGRTAGELALMNAAALGLPSSGSRAVLRRPDGSSLQVELTSRTVDRCTLVTLRQAAPPLSEDQFAKISACVPGLIYTFLLEADGSARLPFATSAAEDVLGLSREALAADFAPLRDNIHCDDVGRVLAGIEESRRSRARWHADFRYLHPHKGLRWIEGWSVPRPAREGTYLWDGFAMDVTERVELEAQLRQAQKMESLGQLSGGLAHDFNNIIGAILGNAELIGLDVGPDHSVAESVEQILQSSARAKNLVEQILTFSHQSPTERHVAALDTAIQTTFKLLRATLPAMIDLVLDLAPDAPRVLADPAQVQQALLNLGSNAWHAIGDKAGRIEISLRGVELDAEQARRLGGLRPGRHACLSVRDDGSGMDAATLERIFDPFFTTKPPGQGTGLGLSVVHGVMHGHEGAVQVASRPGEGSTFRLYFPAAASPPAKAAPPSTPFRRGNGEHLLLLDDEPLLARVYKRSLERMGYRVSQFTVATEAVAAFSADPGHYQAVITDLSMPRTSGLEVAAQMLRVRADIPVLLNSGHVSDGLAAQARSVGIKEVLRKPSTAFELSGALRRLLGAEGQ